MTDLLEYARFHYFSEWVILSVVAAAVLFLNRFFRLNYINALLPMQVIFLFNAIPVIAGSVDGFLGPGRTAHFFLTEGMLMVAVCATYAFILRLGKERYDDISRFFGGTMPSLLIAISFPLAIFVYVVTPQDGTSRILYQTNYWYSLVKPIIAIFLPVSYFAVFVILLVNNRRLPAYVLLVANVLGSIASGSKGAFVLQSVSALLMVRDLGLAPQFRLHRIDLALAAAGLAAGVALSLQRLQLNTGHLWDRIMLFGEPTLLTYFAPDPTAACRTLSLLAKMHRGWARMLGDPGALNIDTLFGYAWTIQYLGVNTFTGPNARYSAYLICNFPGTDIIYGIVMTVLYFVLIILAVRLAVGRSWMLPVVYAFTVFSISGVGQDFNLLMQDVNFLLAMVVLLLLAPRATPQPDLDQDPDVPLHSISRSV